MNTIFLLLAEFNTAQIPLEQVCDKYLKLSPKTAARKASLQQLPFPVFRASTQMSPWLVRAQDLAEFIDAQAAKARNDWNKMNNTAA